MGAVAVAGDAGEGELTGGVDGVDLSSNGGESCQLLGAEVALGVWARQIEVAASISPALKSIFALITRANLRLARPNREKNLTLLCSG